MATVAELRSMFESEPPGEYHPADIQNRVNDDKYLKRVLDHNEGDAKLALQMLIDILTWRKQIGANDLCESNINMEYIYEGSFFAHGRDIDGRLLLIFKCKQHVKGQKDFEELKRCVVFIFDKLEREEKGNLLTLFFDMDGTGIGNMDMEFTKFLINLFKLYYPYFLNYIIIFEMPWVLSAAFKVIKQLLPAKAVSKMKFLNKSTLNQYVSPDQALVCWGGRDDFQYRYEPEDRGDIATASTDVASKKVTFADIEKGDSKHSPGELLSLRPPDCIIFQRDEEETSGSFTMTNADGECVSFKIRTTSPEKFRVRPSSGVIPGHGSQTITVTVQPGFTARVLSRDRFLLMAVQVPKPTLTPQELQEVWQKTTNSKIDEYRLKCVFPDSETKKNGSVLDQMKDPDRQMSALAHAVESLQVDNELLRSQIGHLRSLQYVTVVLTIVVVVFTILIYKSTDESSGFCPRP